MGKKVILIVLDSVGIGAAPDADIYHDEGADTLGHIARYWSDFSLPNLSALGLSRIERVRFLKQVPMMPHCAYGRLQEISVGKDTVTGHWEMCGIISKEAFPTYPEGFPKSMIEAFEKAAGVKIIGNIAASGTEIIQQLGEEHLKTARPIIYTSADSVWQIAAHEEIVPLNQLYYYCEIARELFKEPPHNIGRIIARPFVGKLGAFVRTSNRKDYALLPNKANLLNDLYQQGKAVVAIGKIDDIFAHQAITKAEHTVSNQDGVTKLIEAYQQLEEGLLFVNLVDFDAKFGHRRDIKGYGEALMAFDERLPEILNMLDNDTLLMITADHGCDPSYSGTDHTREFVPLLCYGFGINTVTDLKTRIGFGDIGATIAEFLAVAYSGHGKSFWQQLIAEEGGCDASL